MPALPPRIDLKPWILITRMKFECRRPQTAQMHAMHAAWHGDRTTRLAIGRRSSETANPGGKIAGRAEIAGDRPSLVSRFSVVHVFLYHLKNLGRLTFYTYFSNIPFPTSLFPAAISHVFWGCLVFPPLPPNPSPLLLPFAFPFSSPSVPPPEKKWTRTLQPLEADSHGLLKSGKSSTFTGHVDFWN